VHPAHATVYAWRSYLDFEATEILLELSFEIQPSRIAPRRSSRADTFV